MCVAHLGVINLWLRPTQLLRRWALSSPPGGGCSPPTHTTPADLNNVGVGVHLYLNTQTNKQHWSVHIRLVCHLLTVDLYLLELKVKLQYTWRGDYTLNLLSYLPTWCSWLQHYWANNLPDVHDSNTPELQPTCCLWLQHYWANNLPDVHDSSTPELTTYLLFMTPTILS